jgi:hypothetical protein
MPCAPAFLWKSREKGLSDVWVNDMLRLTGAAGKVDRVQIAGAAQLGNVSRMAWATAQRHPNCV